MSAGVEILDAVTLPSVVSPIDKRTFTIVLTQGLNRQIRRMCEALDYKVLALQRTRIMNIKLNRLARGVYRNLLPQEIDELKELIAESKSDGGKGAGIKKQRTAGRSPSLRKEVRNVRVVRNSESSKSSKDGKSSKYSKSISHTTDVKYKPKSIVRKGNISPVAHATSRTDRHTAQQGSTNLESKRPARSQTSRLQPESNKSRSWDKPVASKAKAGLPVEKERHSKGFQDNAKPERKQSMPKKNDKKTDGFPSGKNHSNDFLKSVGAKGKASKDGGFGKNLGTVKRAGRNAK
jgi:hypothetical protein